jgi:hypothetical protein
MDILQLLINGFKIHLSKNDMHPWWWTYVIHAWMNKCFPSYITDDIHACMNFIYPWWMAVDCPCKVGMNQSIMSTSILLYNMSILWYILCMVFCSKLMNVIQSRDNHQCMVLVYFDTLFALGRTRWKCNLKRQPLNLIIYNMTRILLRPTTPMVMNTHVESFVWGWLGIWNYDSIMKCYHWPWQITRAPTWVVIAICLIVMKNWRANNCKYEIDNSLSLSLSWI